MKKYLAVTALSAALLLAGSAFAREVKVGTECTNPPFNYRTSGGDLAGFDVHVEVSNGRQAAEQLIDPTGFKECAHHLPSPSFLLRLGSKPILDRLPQLNSALPIKPCWR